MSFVLLRTAIKLPSRRDDVADAISQATRVGEACVQLDGVNKGKEAGRYFSIALQLWHSINAFEKCDEAVAAIYCWGRSILNCLSVLVFEGLDDAHSDGPSVGMMLRSEAHYRATIAAYDDARGRLDHRIQATGQQQIVLYQFLDHVDSQINLYRRDRAHGRRWVDDKFMLSPEDELQLQAERNAETRWIEDGGDPPEHMAKAFAEMLAVKIPFAPSEPSILT